MNRTSGLSLYAFQLQDVLAGHSVQMSQTAMERICHDLYRQAPPRFARTKHHPDGDWIVTLTPLQRAA